RERRGRAVGQRRMAAVRFDIRKQDTALAGDAVVPAEGVVIGRGFGNEGDFERRRCRHSSPRVGSRVAKMFVMDAGPRGSLGGLTIYNLTGRAIKSAISHKLRFLIGNRFRARVSAPRILERCAPAKLRARRRPHWLYARSMTAILRGHDVS